MKISYEAFKSYMLKGFVTASLTLDRLTAHCKCAGGVTVTWKNCTEWNGYGSLRTSITFSARLHICDTENLQHPMESPWLSRQNRRAFTATGQCCWRACISGQKKTLRTCCSDSPKAIALTSRWRYWIIELNSRTWNKPNVLAGMAPLPIVTETPRESVSGGPQRASMLQCLRDALWGTVPRLLLSM